MPRAARARTGSLLRYACGAIAIAAALTLAACGSPAPAAQHDPPAPSVAPNRVTPSPQPSASKPRPKPRVVISRFRAADGAVVTLAVFHRPVIFRLHTGGAAPGPAALSVLPARPSLRAPQPAPPLA